ncbi:ankyrin repeat and SOCS box protein 11 [Myxocyprinus asiaticus]|uniref:ankyrin repeat and SOCS box protein 11 n=1 Tax=Myxocyprinus asiaticus TaxID=70543 RepID=UPI0022215D31|nr:ankyrin repeat and SOCS box protein 11 [Myxocyprinus asiaticus]
MALVHTEVSIWSKLWDHRFHVYGGQVCNTLMAGTWDDRTPLHDAALQGRLLLLRRLLSQGYCVGMATLDGITPLHEACVGGHFTCAKILLEHGADANAVSVDGATPLFSACYNGNPTLVSLILMYSSAHHPAHLLKSPLHEAAKRGHTACVELLLSHGVNVDMEVPSIGTALYCACGAKSTDCVRSLLMSGADVQCGWGLDTPLHAATRVCGAAEVELLLEHGADRTSRNSEGKKPLDLTTDQNFKHLLQTLDPCSLSQMCRWRIRRSLGQKRLSKTRMLCLPHTIHNYLLYH